MKLCYSVHWLTTLRIRKDTESLKSVCMYLCMYMCVMGDMERERGPHTQSTQYFSQADMPNVIHEIKNRLDIFCGVLHISGLGA